jgi:6-phosphogluconolactonase/Glucosamine-6-phosphate isomerase/deaminase
MTNQPIIVATAEDAGAYAARLIADGVRAAAREGRDFLLGCPTGRTPAPVFPALAELVAAGLDVRPLVVVLMDEYLEPDGDGFRRVDPAKEYSCIGYAERQILAPLTQAGGASVRLWCPDPAEPEAYDEQIAAAGGIDLFLLASGASDGHIAFNPPGSALDSKTRVIELPDTTRHDNMSTFPVFASLDEVPRYGISVGISTIVGLSKQALLLLTGSDKQYAYARIVDADGYDPNWPATAVKACPSYQLLADAAAARP